MISRPSTEFDVIRWARLAVCIHLDITLDSDVDLCGANAMIARRVAVGLLEK